MYHENLPGVSADEKEAVQVYAAAHASHVSAVMDTVLEDHRHTTADDNSRSREVVEELLRAHQRLVELSPEQVPGRDGKSYAELLALLRELDLGSRDVRTTDEPAVPLDKIPSARQMLYAMIDLDCYFFLTRGEPESARGKELLFDLPLEVRDEMSEEEIAGTHGDRNELCVRLERVLNILEDDSPEGRRQSMFAMGYDCGSEARVFYRCYEQEPDYIDGFVRGAVEYLEVEGSEEDAEAAENSLGMWEDPALTPEEKNELVVECLLADFEIREDESELWRL